MPKPITMEMIDTMSAAERKNLHGNALGRDTLAAKAVLELLVQSELNAPPAVITKTKKSVLKSQPKAKKA